MSGFMFGGSALTLDIGAVNGTGAVVTNGDILQISLLNSDSPDGNIAVVPVLSTGGVSQFAPMGVVIAPDGLSIAPNENITLRVLGRCNVLGLASTGYAVNGVVYGTDSSKALIDDTTVASASYVPAAFGGRLRGVVLTAVTTGTGGELVDCWICGLP
jgi:hypothetical protein